MQLLITFVGGAIVGAALFVPIARPVVRAIERGAFERLRRRAELVAYRQRRDANPHIGDSGNTQDTDGAP